MANPFPLSELLKYDDELAAFYKDMENVERVAHLECQEQRRPHSLPTIWIDDHAKHGYLLQRNLETKTYLLIEMSADTGRWNTYFARDPKDVLRVISERWFKARGEVDWEKLFALIRAAHAVAHPDPESGKEPDPKYLERLMVEALHHFDPHKFFDDRIKEQIGRGDRAGFAP